MLVITYKFSEQGLLRILSLKDTTLMGNREMAFPVGPTFSIPFPGKYALPLMFYLLGGF